MDKGIVVRIWVPLAGGLWALGFLFVKGPGPHDGLRVVGLAIGLLGLAGVILSRYTLGRSFSVGAKATALVTTGIYSRIRNPIYLTAMLFVIGVCLLVRIRYLWLLPVVVIPIQIIRARAEAGVLEAAFGDAYREYRRRTWF